MSTLLVNHPAFRRHETGESHPERPQRMSAIMDYLLAKGVLDHLDQSVPSPCDEQWLTSAHTPAHVERVRAACQAPYNQIDGDTHVSPGSWDAAMLAVGAVLQACDAVMTGRAANAFCVLRPPGHHAESDQAMGFCLFNNVAIGARYLQRKYGLKRVLIIDWDVHHGNGTQEIFYRDPSVFYFSIHQFPYYPGSGAADETGAGEGVGTTLNVPVSIGKGDEEYVAAFREHLMPAARDFAPEAILISAGFDAHRDDPLGAMRVTEDGFARLTALVVDLAHELCGGRIVSVLEGGYNLDALARSVRAHVEVLLHSDGGSGT